MKKQRNTGKAWVKIIVGVIAIVAITLTIIGMITPRTKLNVRSNVQPQQSELSDDPRINIQSKYNELVKRIAATNVCPDVTPVHIFREENGMKYLHATGGQLARDKSILTCGHAFWNIPGERKLPWKFYYQILQPYEKKFHPINRVQTIDIAETNTVQTSRDVILCIPGFAEPIIPIKAPSEASSNKRVVFDYYIKYHEKLPVRSTVTGESFNVIGETKMVNGPAYFVLDCSTFSSQSGTIYVGKDNKTLYILSRSMLLNSELKRVFSLDDSHRGLTLCSSIKID